ncbi:hypothetical protein [Jannaschia sp. W003]|nr:hypothetical protein [Jannaschia sp. W003]UWQ22870.1 hypothetical protein K3554_07560 [Jannaschia sp. W003]
MIETRHSRTYDEAIARAHAERARAFRSLLRFRAPGTGLGRQGARL